MSRDRFIPANPRGHKGIIAESTFTGVIPGADPGISGRSEVPRDQVRGLKTRGSGPAVMDKRVIQPEGMLL
jgi:hypothetical protein